MDEELVIDATDKDSKSNNKQSVLNSRRSAIESGTVKDMPITIV